MVAKYWLYGQEFEKNSGAIGKGEPIEAEIMDQEEKIWKRARVMVFQHQAEGAVPGGLLGPYGEPYDEGKLFLKVLEELREPLEE